MKLYRHFDRNGVLLYVGVSLSAVARLAGHKHAKARWFDQITRVEIATYSDRKKALEAEREIIKRERPLHNIVHAWVAKVEKHALPEHVDEVTQVGVLEAGQRDFATLVGIAQAIPKTICESGPRFYRAELLRRLKLRGWTARNDVKLESGSRGDDTAYRARLELLLYPPAQDPRRVLDDYPIIVETERAVVSYRTRFKLTRYGQRPHRGILVVVLYGDTATCPEATHCLALGLTRIRQ